MTTEPQLLFPLKACAVQWHLLHKEPSLLPVYGGVLDNPASRRGVDDSGVFQLPIFTGKTVQGAKPVPKYGLHPHSLQAHRLASGPCSMGEVLQPEKGRSTGTHKRRTCRFASSHLFSSHRLVGNSRKLEG